MKEKHEHIDKILPQGEMLRGFINQSYIKKSDLNKFLRSKGIFVENTDKEGLAPVLTTLIISPAEFDVLREYQNTREDNIKKRSNRLKLADNYSIEKIMTAFDAKKITLGEEVSYSFEYEPTVEIDKEKGVAEIKFQIERIDRNKSWYESKNVFSGKMEISKAENNQLVIIKSHTSSESKDVLELIERSIVADLKDNRIVEQREKLRRVLFGDFENAERIKFLYKLSLNVSSLIFEFEDIVNIEVTPEVDISLPEDITWMENKRQLKIGGREVHSTFFFKQKEYHEFLKMWELEAKFSFSHRSYKGTCNVSFGFRDFLNKGNKAELELKLSQFKVISKHAGSRVRNSLKRELLDLFYKEKEKKYEEFMEKFNKPTSKQLSIFTP